MTMRPRAVRAMREMLATLGKAGVAVAVFAGVTTGWQYVEARQARAFVETLPLPDEVAQDGCAVWFVGSSSMSRWTSLQDDMRPWVTHNRSIGGATLQELSTRFLNEDEPQPPRAIVFYAGENDLAFGKPVADAVRDLGAFLDHKRERLGDTPVFFLSVKPSPVRWNLAPQQDAYNAAVRGLAARRRDLFFIDVRSRFLVSGRPGPFYVGDGLHMNERGYAIFAGAVRSALEEGLPRDIVQRCRRRSDRT